jgi:hypothetical protein
MTRAAAVLVCAATALALAAFPAKAASRLVAPTEAVALRLEHFGLDVGVDYEHGTLGGAASLAVRNVSRAPVREVPLLLNRLMRFEKVTLDRRDLRVRQEVVTFEDLATFQVNFARVALPKPLRPGERATLVVEYGGHLVGYEETGMLYIRDKISEEYTIIRQDSLGFPCLGVPSFEANRRAGLPDFTFDVRVTVPKRFVVAAGGTAEPPTLAGESATYRFVTRDPAPFVNVAVAAFKTLDRGDTRVYYLPADEEGAKVVAERAERALELLGRWCGPHARTPRGTIIEIPDGWGSQASLVAGIIQSAASFRDPSRLGELYHELSHFWNVPDRDLPSPRWNEGLATYLEKVMSEELDRRTDFKARAGRGVDRVLERAASDPQLGSVPLRDYGARGMTDLSYTVGYLYFYVLERVIGREALLADLREYFQSHKLEGGTLAQLTALLAERSPQSVPVTADWVDTARWLEKLRKAGSADAVAETYLQPGRH